MSDLPRVAFDLTPVISGRTGIARYVAQLQAALGGEPVELRPFAVGRSAFGVPAGHDFDPGYAGLNDDLGGFA